MSRENIFISLAGEFFDIEVGEETLYACMLFVTQVRTAYRQQLQAITHVGGSARIQVVSRETQPQFWTVLNEFGQMSGMPVLLNTSFNVRGQPIVCTPAEAVSTFLWAGLDALVMGNYLVLRLDAVPAEEQETLQTIRQNKAPGSRRE